MLIASLLLVPLPAHAQSAAVAPATPGYEFTEIATVDVPESLKLSGLSVHASGILGWSQSGGQLLTYNDAQAAVLNCVCLRSPLAASPISDSTIAVFDADPPSVVVVTLSGRFKHRRHVVLPFDPMAALLVDEQLFVAGATEEGSQVLRLGPDGRSSDIYLFEGIGDGARAPTVWLSRSQDGVLASRREEPFETIRIGLGDSVSIGWKYAQALPGRSGTASDTPQAGKWVAMPTIDLGSGYLQTISDIQSDRRLLVRYSDDGTVVATRMLHAPFAFSAGLVTTRRVVGMRAAEGAEIVIYEWTRSEP